MFKFFTIFVFSLFALLMGGEGGEEVVRKEEEGILLASGECKSEDL